MKVIFSTGHGRLHFIQAAVSLKKLGTKIIVITGWIPGKMFSDKFINRLGKFIGRSSNLASGLRKRTPKELAPEELKSCGTAEFLVQFLFKLSSYRLFKRADGAVLGWKVFGLQSRRFIKNADIFHVRSGAGRGGAIRKARQSGMKIVVDHSIAHPREMERQLIKSAKRDNIRHNSYLATWPSDKFWDSILEDCSDADMLVVNSEYVKWSFMQEGYPEKKIKVIQWGVSQEFESIKRNYHSPVGIKLVFTGGFGSRKGATIILEALQILRDKGVEFTFDVIGSVMSDIVIPEWVKEASAITFHGHLPQTEMTPLLEQSDVYIFPTYSEGSAQSVKEAMSVGLPVITTKQCGSPIVSGENGLLIKDDDATALAEAIVYLSTDEILREKMGKSAAQTIRQDHTWDKYAGEISRLYRELTD